MNDIIKLTYQPEGEEIRIMVFVKGDGQGDDRYYYNHPNPENKASKGFHPVGSYFLEFDKWGRIMINPTSIGGELNPLYLEFITLKECSEGEGRGVAPLSDPAYDDLHQGVECGCCTDGRVEVVTLKVLFKPKEYDEALYNKGWDDAGKWEFVKKEGK